MKCRSFPCEQKTSVRKRADAIGVTAAATEYGITRRLLQKWRASEIPEGTPKRGRL